MSDEKILTDAQADALLDDGGNCDNCRGRIGGTPIPVDGKKLCKYCAQKKSERKQ